MPSKRMRRRVSVPRRARLLDVYLVCTLFFVGICVIFTRIVNLQNLHKAYAGNSELNNTTEILYPVRGSIYDRNDEHIAGNSFSMDVVISKTKLERLGHEKYKFIASLLGVDSSGNHYKKLLKYDSRNIILKNFPYHSFDYDSISKELIENRMGSVLLFVPRNERYYPLKRFYSSFLCYADPKSEQRWGVEETYNELLQGEEGERTYIKTRRLPLFYEKDALDGSSIKLTLDSAVQFVVEAELKKAVLNRKARSGHVLVTKPKTGEILAMASYKRGATHINSEIVTGVFEPGSTIKPIIAAIALENKVVDGRFSEYCEKGRYNYQGRVIRDHSRFETLSLSEIITHSSNIGMVKLGSKIGDSLLYSNLEKFGFGSRTGIDLPSESRGIFPDLKHWTRQTKASVSFGYGLSVNTVQMTFALNALINNGVYKSPKLVKSVIDPNGSTADMIHSGESRPVISEVTSSTMRNIMRDVVRSGTGKDAFIEGLDVGGKTGTSKKVLNGKYSDHYISSFYGFFPASDPEISIYVVIDDPKGEYYGGEVAAPVFKEVASKIYPFIIEDLDSRYGGSTTFVDMRFVDQYKTFEKTSPENVTPGIVPDLKGMLLRDALRMAHQAGFALDCRGNGIVKSQYPSPGTLLTPGESIRVKGLRI